MYHGGIKIMKKFINDVDLVEEQMIQGMVKAYPQYLKKLDCGNAVSYTHLLYRKADKALYTTKNRGKSGFTIET